MNNYYDYRAGQSIPGSVNVPKKGISMRDDNFYVVKSGICMEANIFNVSQSAKKSVQISTPIFRLTHVNTFINDFSVDLRFSGHYLKIDNGDSNGRLGEVEGPRSSFFMGNMKAQIAVKSGGQAQSPCQACE
jgi:hypothetical protein